MASIILAAWWFGGCPQLFQKLIELVEPGIIEPGKAAGAAHFCWLSLKGAFSLSGFLVLFSSVWEKEGFWVWLGFNYES
jgi:hypothetical protein